MNRLLIACAVVALVVGAGAAGYELRQPATATSPVRVLVANSAAAKGTPARSVSYSIVPLRSSAVQAGAVSDPSAIAGKVAVKRILPGEQLTASDFH